MLGRVIADVGPCKLAPKPHETFDALLRSITFQQLNGRAAETIYGRVQALFPGGLTPERLLAHDEKALRGAGLSANKLKAMRDLAQKTLDGTVPARKAAEAMADAELIERLCEVRGIGEWTAQMFLMFYLGRPDVLPLADFGIQSAFRKLYGGRRSLEKQGAVWAPHRTVASWYLWRSLD